MMDVSICCGIYPAAPAVRTSQCEGITFVAIAHADGFEVFSIVARVHLVCTRLGGMSGALLCSLTTLARPHYAFRSSGFVGFSSASTTASTIAARDELSAACITGRTSSARSHR
jgi:hypothetical protein